VCDNTRSSRFFGHCYTEFDDFGNNEKIEMSTSTDGGQTWGAPRTTAAGDYGTGGQPVVQPNGTVIVPIDDAEEENVLAFRSTDGGASWSAAVKVSPIRFHVDAGGLRSAALPSAAIGRAGRVYVAWQDCRFRAGCSSNDIVLSMSDDGLHWSPVDRVPIDPVSSGADHFIPGLAVDPLTSGAQTRLALTYYYYPSASCTVETCQLDVGTVRSSDDGAHWTAPVQLAGPMSLSWLPETGLGYMVGDYISTSFVNHDPRPFFALAKPPVGGLFNEAIYTIQGHLEQGGGQLQPAQQDNPTSIWPGSVAPTDRAPAAPVTRR